MTSLASWSFLYQRFMPEGLDRSELHGNTDLSTTECIEAYLKSGNLHAAHQLVQNWLHQWAKSLPSNPSLTQLCKKDLWKCLYRVIEHTHDDSLNEKFWQTLDGIKPAPNEYRKIPLLGVPILNRFDLLENMLASLDFPVQNLAIVDNSFRHDAGKLSELGEQLEKLQRRGHPMVDQIHIARGFRNLGVAASWNLILTSFPEANVTLLINNDVRLAPGILSNAFSRINTDHPQFLSLLPHPQTFSAFLITVKAWDRVGLLDYNFHPAYCEDLDYSERLRADSEVEWLDGSDFHLAMNHLNTESSHTIQSDPYLAGQNEISFALNRLWFLSHRRVRGDRRGTWIRHWINQWKTKPSIGMDS